MYILYHTSQSLTHAACRDLAVAPLTVCLFGCRGAEPEARSQWFDALTIAGWSWVVKWGVPLWLVSRSAPLSGLLETRDERRCVRCRSGPPLVCTLYSSSEVACQGVDRSALLMGRQSGQVGGSHLFWLKFRDSPHP